MMESNASGGYRGRIAPTPSGHLHLGHGRTFYRASERARKAGGALVLRLEDLDPLRSRPEFIQSALKDLRALGIVWQEGPDAGGPYGPYIQSERMSFYLEGWQRLHATGLIYPCELSRKDVERALLAPHENQEACEPIFPPELRPPIGKGQTAREPGLVNWRFAVPTGEAVAFLDSEQGRCSYVAGRDFGDFLVWRKDGFPSYELACVIDDHLMLISEVVRGADLLLSTARQLLLYAALQSLPPSFCHLPLVRDESGQRLSKRSGGFLISEWIKAGRAQELLTWIQSDSALLPGSPGEGQPAQKESQTSEWRDHTQA